MDQKSILKTCSGFTDAAALCSAFAGVEAEEAAGEAGTPIGTREAIYRHNTGARKSVGIVTGTGIVIGALIRTRTGAGIGISV